MHTLFSEENNLYILKKGDVLTLESSGSLADGGLFVPGKYEQFPMWKVHKHTYRHHAHSLSLPVPFVSKSKGPHTIFLS